MPAPLVIMDALSRWSSWKGEAGRVRESGHSGLKEAYLPYLTEVLTVLPRGTLVRLLDDEQGLTRMSANARRGIIIGAGSVGEGLGSVMIQCLAAGLFLSLANIASLYGVASVQLVPGMEMQIEREENM